MTSNRIGPVLALTLLALVALPITASAQGRGNGRDREATERRDRDWESVDERDRRGPPFCRNGEGHPVHGWEWCRDKGFDRDGSLGDIIFGDDRYYDEGRYDSRDYDRAHDEFHRALDRRYIDRASRRPLDLRYQLELRREKEREHERWHERR